MRIVVVGLGKVGRALTAQLTAENNDIVVIDQNADLIEDIVNIYDVRGLVGNGGCYDVQKEAFEDGAAFVPFRLRYRSSETSVFSKSP